MDQQDEPRDEARPDAIPNVAGDELDRAFGAMGVRG